MRSLQEISKNLSGNIKIEIPSCELILVSPICSHSYVMKYLFICGILSKNNCVAFCNAFLKTESSPAREENTLLTHHNQLSLSNKSCWDCFISISNWRLLTIMPLPIKPLRPRLTRPTRPIKPMRPTRLIKLMWPRTRMMRRPRLMKPTRQLRPTNPRPMRLKMPMKPLWPARPKPKRPLWPMRPLWLIKQ